jgi:hypothetical protein
MTALLLDPYMMILKMVFPRAARVTVESPSIL